MCLLVRRKIASIFYTERTSNMVRDEEGKPTRMEGIIKDVTGRK